MENIDDVFNPYQILRNGASVTPNDSADLEHYGVLYVGTGGDVKVDLIGSGTITYAVGDGEFLPILVKKVYDTDTTASDIVVHW